MSSSASRYSPPRAASAAMTLPPSNRSRTSSTARPWKIAGKPKRISPSVPSSTGLVKTSPAGDVPPKALGIGPRERARVRVRPDGDERVHQLDLALLDRRDVRQLLVPAELEQELDDPGQLRVHVHVGPASQRGAVEPGRER